MGQGWPTVTTLGTAPERGKFRVAKPGCRVRFLFGYFLFRASKEKVTRRKAETGSSQRATVNGYMAAKKHNALHGGSRQGIVGVASRLASSPRGISAGRGGRRRAQARQQPDARPFAHRR